MLRLLTLGVFALLLMACSSIQDAEDGPGRITAMHVANDACLKPVQLASGEYGTRWVAPCIAPGATPEPVEGPFYLVDMSDTTVPTEADYGRYLRWANDRHQVIYADPPAGTVTTLPMRIGWSDTSTFTAAAFPSQTGTTARVIVPQYTGTAPAPFVAVWVQGAVDGEVTGIFEGDNSLVGPNLVFADFTSSGLAVDGEAGRMFVSAAGVDPAVRAGQAWRATISRAPQATSDGVANSVGLTVDNGSLRVTIGRSGSLADLTDTVTLPGSTASLEAAPLVFFGATPDATYAEVSTAVSGIINVINTSTGSYHTATAAQDWFGARVGSAAWSYTGDVVGLTHIWSSGGAAPHVWVLAPTDTLWLSRIGFTYDGTDIADSATTTVQGFARLHGLLYDLKHVQLTGNRPTTDPSNITRFVYRYDYPTNVENPNA